jgi:carboxylate-amine ligase
MSGTLAPVGARGTYLRGNRSAMAADHAFGSGQPFALGVEEELFLADRADGTMRNAGEDVLAALRAPARGEVKGEVHACEVELITDVCGSAAEAAEVLAGLRGAVLDTGIGLIGSATHPTAEEGEAEITDQARYRYISTLLGDALVTPVAALHVHVGMPDPETAIRAFNALRRHLPLLEALAANSPFRHGRDSGFASARELAIRGWARSGAPREMAGWEDFEASTARLTKAADVPDYTYHWWKLRPHPRLGTVEIRALDVQASLDHARGLAALVRALARHGAEAEPVRGPAPEILEEGSYRAAREGLAARLPEPDGTLRPAADLLDEALALAREPARALGDAEALDEVADLVADGGGAGIQRAAGGEGDMAALLRTLLRRAAGDAA